MKHTRIVMRSIAASLGALALLGGPLVASPAAADPLPITISYGISPLDLPVAGPAIDSVVADYYDDAGNYIASTPESDSPADNTLLSNDSPDPGDSLTELPDPEGTVASQLLTDDSPAVVADIQNTACSSGKVCGTPTYSGTVTWHVWHTQYSSDGYTVLYRYNLDVHYAYKARKINTSTLWVHSYMTKEDLSSTTWATARAGTSTTTTGTVSPTADTRRSTSATFSCAWGAASAATRTSTRGFTSMSTATERCTSTPAAKHETASALCSSKHEGD